MAWVQETLAPVDTQDCSQSLSTLRPGRPPRQSTKGMALWPSWELGFRGFWGTLGSLGGTRQETTWGQVRGIPGASGTILESLVGCLVASLVLSSPDSTEPGE